MNRRHLLRTLGAAGAATALAPFGGSAARAAAAPQPWRAARVSDLQARLSESVARHRVAGASAAVFRNGTLETAVAGVTNVATGVEMTPDTVLHIGSITKVFNTTLVMQLVDEGRLALDAPVRRYLPEFTLADRDAAARITVRMLLNHTSGIDGELTQEAGHDRERVEDAMARIATMGQIHEPGTDLSYCNAGTVIAGYLMQRVTGTSWYDLMKQRIFAPLGMSHAIVVPEDALLYRASVGHFPGADGTLTRTPFAFLPLSYAPAGATAMMSAADLVTFARAHLQDGRAPNGARLLSAAGARAMRTRTATYQGPSFGSVGLGWMLRDAGIVTHSGGGPGILSAVYAHPASDTAVAVLTNSAHGTLVIADIVRPLLEVITPDPFGVEGAELAARATDAPVDPAPYAGQYENIASAVRVIPHGNGIAMTSRAKFKYYETTSITESPPVPLRPIGNGQFAVGDASAIGFVNPDAGGTARHLATGGRLLKRTGSG